MVLTFLVALAALHTPGVLRQYRGVKVCHYARLSDGGTDGDGRGEKRLSEIDPDALQAWHTNHTFWVRGELKTESFYKIPNTFVNSDTLTGLRAADVSWRRSKDDYEAVFQSFFTTRSASMPRAGACDPSFTFCCVHVTGQASSPLAPLHPPKRSNRVASANTCASDTRDS